MKKILITIGEGQFSNQQIKQLEGVVLGYFKQHISSEQPFVLWNITPKGNGFNDYIERQSSLIAVECAENFQQEKRVAFFKACTKDWLAITGQSIDHLIIAIYESPLFNDLLGRNARQMTAFGKFQFYSKMLLSAVYSKLTKGYHSFSTSI